MSRAVLSTPRTSPSLAYSGTLMTSRSRVLPPGNASGNTARWRCRDCSTARFIACDALANVPFAASIACAAVYPIIFSGGIPKTCVARSLHFSNTPRQSVTHIASGLASNNARMLPCSAPSSRVRRATLRRSVHTQNIISAISATVIANAILAVYK